MQQILRFSLLSLVFALSTTLGFAAERLPPPKLETQEYREARAWLIENLHPDEHAPALRVLHRMMDKMMDYAMSMTRPANTNRPEILRYSMDYTKRDGQTLHRFNIGYWLGRGYSNGNTRGQNPWEDKEGNMFLIRDKHIVEIGLHFYEDIGCGCCHWTGYLEYDKELLADIAKFSKVREIRIQHSNSHANIDPEGLAKLKEIEQIDRLTIERHELCEEIFRSLGQLENMRELTLIDIFLPGWEDTGFRHYTTPEFDASYISHFAPLQNLRLLRIRSNGSSITSFPHLSGLEELYLYVAEISDEALEQIKELPNIKRIEINRQYIREVDGRDGFRLPTTITESIFQFTASRGR